MFTKKMITQMIFSVLGLCFMIYFLSEQALKELSLDDIQRHQKQESTHDDYQFTNMI